MTKKNFLSWRDLVNDWIKSGQVASNLKTGFLVSHRITTEDLFRFLLKVVLLAEDESLYDLERAIEDLVRENIYVNEG